MKSTVEGSMVAERFDDGEKDKKKKRRSNRRAKQNPPSSSASEVNEAIGVSSECFEKNGTPTQTTGSFSNSLKQQGVNVSSSNEQGLSKASIVESVSTVLTHLNDRVEPVDMKNMQIHEGGIDPKLCLVPCSPMHLNAQRNYFSPHWSVEAVEKELEKGDVYKAVFHVNAHNKLEAYCKIEGVPTDILIGGVPAQNRAVEGDIVAIKIDPLPLWTKMKGVNGGSNNTEVRDGCNVLVEDSNVSDNNHGTSMHRSSLGQNKEESYQNSSPCRNYPFSEKRYIYEDNTAQGLANHLSLVALAGCDSNNGLHFEGSASLKINSGGGQSEVMNVVKQLCLLVNSFPSKRPTGRVVAIIERSPRRECIVGHLNLKQCGLFQDINKKDARKNKNFVSEHEYIQLLPIDPKFPNIKLLVRELPENIKRRLKSDDATIEMDLVAAQLDDWVGESPFPEGHILHVFGRDTALDKEAQLRSTSVYMLQKKLSMLPALISDNIGSLNPGVDRLAVSMLLDVTVAGEVVDRWIGRTVIKSCCKLSYENAQDIIDKAFDFERSNIYEDNYPKVHGHFVWPDVITSLKSLYEISNVLKRKRFTEGALRLNTPKIVILFDENGIPYDSMFSEQKESNFLIEEFMLLANTTAAEIISRAYPNVSLLRRHPEPNMRKLREFSAFCQKHGFNLDISSSGQIHWSLEKIKEKLNGDPVFYDILISYATRPMQLASYFCSGDLKDNEHEWAHYSLAVPLYTHFTSPLRRYSDIVVHRTLLATIEAEEKYLKQVAREVEVKNRCFTGIYFDKKAAESVEGKEALSAAALKHRVPSAKILGNIAAHCNDRKLASRYVKDACDRLYMWYLLKHQKVLLSEARIMGLGPKFMSVYIQKLAIEKRIYYDEVEGLTAEWLEATSTLVLSMSLNKRALRRGSPNKWRALSEVALIACPYDLKVTVDSSDQCDLEVDAMVSNTNQQHISISDSSVAEIEPAVFPLTVHLLSKIPVALHAVGGDDGPLDFGVRMYMSSYMW
uniref:Protein SUPPRESSOR OF VARICOSE n=1 Tax=Cicer arietinum TaxID=3827 RepID=A0A3Q7YC57_CICAR|nr:DIS3-like exonuclease 2 isoform X2 [Cicer arietinum]